MVLLDVSILILGYMGPIKNTRNIPIGVAVFISILSFVHLGHASKRANRCLPLSQKLQHIDALGTVLFIGSIGCLLLALQWGGQQYQWHDSKIIGLFVGFGLLGIIFGFVQWKRGEYATISLRVLRKRSILMGALFLMFIGMSSLVVGPLHCLVRVRTTS